MQITAYQDISTVSNNSALCYCYLSCFGNWQGNDLVTETLRKTAYTPNFNYTQISELQQCYPIRFLSFLTLKYYDLFIMLGTLLPPDVLKASVITKQ